MDFSELLKPYLKKTNKTYYVALSGGVDSFVLLNELLKIRENYDLKLSAIHVNHNIQKDSLKWKNFCSEFCRKNRIKYFSRTLRKKTDFSNLEKKLRDERYKIFESILDKNSILFMGHHLDDTIETFFLRSMRGTRLEGLTSIPRERNLGRGKIVRPFLDLTKTEILKKAKEDKLKFVNDLSNRDNSFDRNYIRNIVLPELEKRWPSYRKNLKQLIENLRETKDLLSIQRKIDFDQVKVKKNQISINKLLNLPLARQKGVFLYWIDLNQFNPPSAKVVNLFFKKFLKDNKTPKAKYSWGSNSKKGSVCIIKIAKDIKITKTSA